MGWDDVNLGAHWQTLESWTTGYSSGKGWWQESRMLSLGTVTLAPKNIHAAGGVLK